MFRRAAWVLGGVLAFLAALAFSGVGGCNVHELGHLVTGRLAGVPVNDIMWCTPFNGRIAFAYQEPAFVGYAGGFLAAFVLLGVHLGFIRSRLISYQWWMAGVAVLGTAISQVIVGVLEGSDPQAYADLQVDTTSIALVVIGPLVVAAAIQLLMQRPAGPRTKGS